jgi:thiol-disulfide isomerase/thioredoxin
MKKIIIPTVATLLLCVSFLSYSNLNTDKEGFTLRNMNGEMVSLSDFKGKVVYIDYWATWCMPCMMEINKAKKLKTYFQNNDNIVFLYVSIDKDEQKWKDVVEKKDIKGYHLISSGGKEDNLLQRFGINTIPRFMLVNKAGKIVDYTAKTPGENALIQDIEKLLAE